MAHHSPKKHRGAGPGMKPVEKAKDFKGAIKRLFFELAFICFFVAVFFACLRFFSTLAFVCRLFDGIYDQGNYCIYYRKDQGCYHNTGKIVSANRHEYQETANKTAYVSANRADVGKLGGANQGAAKSHNECKQQN